LDGSEVIAILAIGGPLAVGLVLGLAGIICANWRQVRQHQSEIALKSEMIRKEMRVEDIERIIRATGPWTSKTSKPNSFQLAMMAPRQLDARVATLLAGWELDAEKIDHAVGAVVAANVETKRAVAEALQEMCDQGVDANEMVACVLALCKSSPTGITAL
jgi:hypothetical protein